jgi:hypothetical protein
MKRQRHSRLPGSVITILTLQMLNSFLEAGEENEDFRYPFRTSKRSSGRLG